MAPSEESQERYVVGKRIRDEFMCPITFELLRDPVVASDGHTYERNAIVRWLQSSRKSPRTTEEMTDKIVPNINLRKLIRDMVEEGGESLYVKDINGNDRKVALQKETFLTFECLGPQDSSWFRNSFHVTSQGCLGGRRINDKVDKESFTFKDTTVSREHFEVYHATDPLQKVPCFFLRDRGSAGGTYIRIPHGKAKQLNKGMIFLFGKHQLQVIHIVTGPTQNCDEDEAIKELSRCQLDGEAVTESLLFSDTNFKTHRADYFSTAIKAEEDFSADSHSRNSESIAGNPITLNSDSEDHKNSESYVTLQCIAPEGSPLLNAVFNVDGGGGIIGRRLNSAIHLGDGDPAKATMIDTAISSEHARIVYENNMFYILDGSAHRASTNGTWFRLSAAREQSPPFPIRHGDEVLFGTIRFTITEGTTITEVSKS